MKKKIAGFAIATMALLPFASVSNTHADDFDALLKMLEAMEQGEANGGSLDDFSFEEPMVTTTSFDNTFMDAEMDLDTMFNNEMMSNTSTPTDSVFNELNNSLNTYSGEANIVSTTPTNSFDGIMGDFDFEPETTSNSNLGNTNVDNSQNYDYSGHKLTPTGLTEMVYLMVLLSVIGGVYAYRRKKAA